MQPLRPVAGQMLLLETRRAHCALQSIFGVIMGGLSPAVLEALLLLAFPLPPHMLPRRRLELLCSATGGVISPWARSNLR